MSEEKKEKSATNPEAEKKAPAAPAAESEKSDRIKVTQMTLPQVEKAIQETIKNMGGLHSRYGKALAERKQFLLKYPNPTGHKVA